MGMGFQLEQHRLELRFEKTISWEMGLGSPLHDPLYALALAQYSDFAAESYFVSL